MPPAIRVERLTKSYTLAHGPRVRYRTLRDALSAGVGELWQAWRSGRTANAVAEPRWVLRDVSFEAQPGELVGVVGRNGAGKSTLLKILSRITEPSGGRAELRGRVGSVLEVGAGFHAELSGRDNIHLNGTILGMRRDEIRRQFDAIVEFAEIGPHLERPVKHYSTGMRLRLAFAVACHFTPDILLLDEVLAVGDAAFQRKCLDKMQDSGRQGRTLLLVSHQLTAITDLCSRALWLEDARLVQDGPAAQVVAAYLQKGLALAARRAWPVEEAPGDAVARLLGVRVADAHGRDTGAVDVRQPVLLEMDYEVLRPHSMLLPTFHLFTPEGICVCVLLEQDPAWQGQPRPAGLYRSQVRIPGNFLTEGFLQVGAGIITPQPFQAHCYEREAVGFQVSEVGDGPSARGAYAGPLAGVVRPLWPWVTTYAG